MTLTHLRLANVRHAEALAWTWDGAPEAVRTHWRPLCESRPVGGWGPEGTGLFLFGPPGVGKTAVCVLSIRARIAYLATHGIPVQLQSERGINRWALDEPAAARLVAAVTGETPAIGELWYERWPAVSRRLLQCPPDVRARAEWHLLDIADLLCLDEIGAGAPTDAREALLSELVERPLRYLPTIVCMNATSPTAVVAAVGPRVADRLFDSRYYRVVALTGASRRGHAV